VTSGTVIWFDPVRRVGGITEDGSGREVAVRGAEIDGGGLQTLRPRDRVCFSVSDGPTARAPCRSEPLESAPSRIDRSNTMAQGTVKWFSDEQGYGFIAQDEGPDIFVHHSGIDSQGFRSLVEGQHVEFDLAQGQKGPHAIAVRAV
jgi:cold shock protein